MRQNFALSFQLIVCSKKCRPLLLLFSVHIWFFYVKRNFLFPKKRYTTVNKMRKIFQILESQVLKIPRKNSRLWCTMLYETKMYIFLFLFFRNRQSPWQFVSNKWQETRALVFTWSSRSSSDFVRKSLCTYQRISRCKYLYLL